jgi:lactoylglutathione lyase
MFTAAFAIFSVADMSRALGFYRDLLGFTEAFRFPESGEPVYVGLDLGSSHLGIGASGGSLPTDPGALARERPFELWVYAENCDAAIEY